MEAAVAAVTAAAICAAAAAVDPEPMLTLMAAHGVVATDARARCAASSARRLAEGQMITALAAAIAVARSADDADVVLICVPLGMYTAVSDSETMVA